MQILFNGRQSVYRSMLLLLVICSFISQGTELLENWWIGQERYLKTSWQRVWRAITLPRWYSRLQVVIDYWRAKLKNGNLVIWLGCYLLAVLGLVWVSLLRWLLEQMMKRNGEPYPYSWIWNGALSSVSDSMELQVMIQITERVAEQVELAEESWRLFPQSNEKEQEIVIEGWSTELGLTSLPARTSSGEQTEAELNKGITCSHDENRSSVSTVREKKRRSGAINVVPATTRIETREEKRPKLDRITDPIWIESQSPATRTKVVTSELDGDNQWLALDQNSIQQLPLSISAHFSKVDDPRINRTKKHQLLDLITIAICAVVGGADTWVDVENFGEAKRAWFNKFLDLPNGIPSHDTFGRVFARLDAEQFQRGFLQWVQTISKATRGQIVPIDGKMLRRSHDKTLGKNAIHMVSAWASENRLVLGQVKVDEKSNEITAIPALLEMLEISGCIVTIDAMGCQKEIVKKIVANDADYVLALKGNQSGLLEDVQTIFANAENTGFERCDYHKTVDNNHGRIETRQCWTISDPNDLLHLRSLSAWKNLHTIAMVRAERQLGDKTSVEDRFFISSLTGQAEQMLHAVRTHWEIENSVHWVLDIAFREDDSRIRKGNGAQNFAVLRHLALNLLKQENTAQCGIKAKRLKAGWDESYLLEILSNFT